MSACIILINTVVGDCSIATPVSLILHSALPVGDNYATSAASPADGEFPFIYRPPILLTFFFFFEFLF